MSLALWLTILSPCHMISLTAANSLPSLTIFPAINATGFLSRPLVDAMDVEKAPKLTHPLPFIIGGPLSSKMGSDGVSRRASLAKEGGPTFMCNAGLYGRPNALSCQQAWLDIPGGSQDITFGNRTADQAWDVPLPFRFISRDGTCVLEFDQTQIGSIVNDTATGGDMTSAASELIRKCSSIQARDRGGIASNLGEEGRLSLIVREYKPNVQCSITSFIPTGGLREACQTALNSMPVSKFSQAFGPNGDTGAQSKLPISFSDAGSRCFVTVDMNGSPVSANWYDIWASAIAIMGMCVVDGKAGLTTTQVGGSRITVRIQFPSGGRSLRGIERL